MIRTCIWLERSFGSREVCWPKLRETPKGHILSSEALKLCFPQCHKIYVSWYFCLLTYLMGRMRDMVPRLEWKRTVDEKAWLFSLVAQSCPTVRNPMNCSTPGFLVHHQLPESTQIHVHRVSDDVIQPFQPLSSPSPPAFTLSWHQGLSSESVLCIRWPKLLEFQLQHPSFQWLFGTDFL